jgi:hypothetical protein
MHATVEEIEAEKSLIEDQAICNNRYRVQNALLSAQVLCLGFN